MSSELHTAALKAVAALAALEAQAQVEGKLWPDDVRALASARGVANGLAQASSRSQPRC